MNNASNFHTFILEPERTLESRDREQNNYPPISHDRMPHETECAQTFQDAQNNLNCRQRKRNRRRNNGDTDPSRPIEK